MSNLLKIVSSQFKHPAGRVERYLPRREISSGSALRNEPFSFQILYRAVCEKASFVPVSISVRSEGMDFAAYRVDPVAVTQAANLLNEPGYEGNEPGLYPDVLMQRPADPVIEEFTFAFGPCRFEKGVSNLLNALEYDYQSLWITANPESKPVPPGVYTVEIVMTSLKTGEVLETETFTLEIIDELLPEQTAYYTNWLYEDAICDTYHVSLYSKEFYEIFDDYVTNAARHRQNTLLLPAFTPPLDTPIGKERMNVQLVDITKTAAGWKFGFDRMKEFIDHAKTCGITCFEHNHLFYQWGAKNAPNIYDTDGNRIFGYETDAMGEEYQTFLHAYLEAFLAFAKEEEIYDKLVFHISDEPNISHLECYTKAVKSVEDVLKPFPVADALSEIEYHRKKLVKNPICFVDQAEKFYAENADLWVYYTGGPHHAKGTNRLITNTAARTRVLGVQMYRYKALGFLHWGYNYFYDRLTAGIFDPRANPCGYKQFPGAAHLVYPLHGIENVFVAPSIREKHMAEAMDDLRALQLLEQKIGREEVLSLCEAFFGTIVDNKLIPSEDDLYLFREMINKKIKDLL